MQDIHIIDVGIENDDVQFLLNIRQNAAVSI